jgi:hypothetical protein
MLKLSNSSLKIIHHRLRRRDFEFAISKKNFFSEINFNTLSLHATTSLSIRVYYFKSKSLRSKRATSPANVFKYFSLVKKIKWFPEWLTKINKYIYIIQAFHLPGYTICCCTEGLMCAWSDKIESKVDLVFKNACLHPTRHRLWLGGHP